jgi:hypothetical protein
MRDVSLSYVDGSTLTGADAILEQYEIALFTVPGEFSAEPAFGIGVQQWVGEVNDSRNAKAIRQHIIAKTKELFPEISIVSVSISRSNSTLSVNLEVVVMPYNQRGTIKKDITE